MKKLPTLIEKQFSKYLETKPNHSEIFEWLKIHNVSGKEVQELINKYVNINNDM